jgi:hypothetical protein
MYNLDDKILDKLQWDRTLSSVYEFQILHEYDILHIIYVLVKAMRWLE